MQSSNTLYENENKLKATYANSYKAGRHTSIDIEMELISYRITNIYAPNIPKKKNFFSKIRYTISR